MQKVMRVLLITLFTISWAGSVYGQASYTPSRWGFRGGMTIAILKGENLDNLQNRYGFIGGLYYNKKLIGLLSLQTEIYYVQKGAKLEFQDLGETVSYKTKLDYVEIPVLVKLDLAMVPLIRPHFFVGPAFGILVQATSEYEFAGRVEETDVQEYYKGSDVGLILGAGVSFNILGGDFMLDFSYNMGQSDINNNQEANTSAINNDVYLFTLGIGF